MTLPFGYGLTDVAGVDDLTRLQSRAFILCALGGRPAGRGHYALAHGGRQGGVHAAVTVQGVPASGGSVG
jgi:hypothetical protein